MVGHVKSSEKKLGKSAKEAENIAWATANKRGMLNNKKKVAEGSETTYEIRLRKDGGDKLMARNVPKSQVGAKLAALSKKHNVAVGEFEYFKTGDLKEQGMAEGLGYSQDPEQSKWYHEGRKALQGGTTGNLIQDIAKKHGCPPEWLKAFHAGYQDQEGWGKEGMAEGWKEKLGAAALAGSMALGAASGHAGGVSLDSNQGFQPQDQVTLNQRVQQQQNKKQDLGNGFVQSTVELAGKQLAAVLDTHNNTYYTLNKNADGFAIFRTPARYISIKNDQMRFGNSVGPEVAAALQAAGLTATAPGTTNEGRFVKGPGGVPLDRQGNAIPPKPQAEPKAPVVRRDANGLTRADYNTVWRKIEDVVGQIFPDGDPIDWLGPWLDRKRIQNGGEVLNKACRLNGFKDIYDYYDHFKTADYGYEAPVREEKEKTNSEGDISTITDPELRHAIEKAKTHYGGIKDPITAFRKLTVRGLKHAEETDHRQDEKIKDFEQVINRMKQEIFSLRQRVSSPVSEGEITEDDVVLSADRRIPKSGLLSKPEPTTNPADTVKLDVPLLIRLLEFSKEDAVDDMALHDLAEKLVAGCQRGRTLTMKDYDSLVPAKQPEVPEPGMDESLLGGAAAAGIIANDDDEDFQVSFQRQMEEDQTNHKFRILAFLKSNEPGDVGQRKEFTITARTDREAKILAKQILAARGMEVRELHIIGSEEIA
jgi:hypothetical protein